MTGDGAPETEIGATLLTGRSDPMCRFCLADGSVVPLRGAISSRDWRP